MMIIDSVSISNFKSFDETVVKLNNYTVLIGANGSGKSNFFNALKFMSDALDNNIEYAISRQGGLNYLWNVNIKYDKNTKIKIRFIYDEDDINNITRYQKRNRLVEEKALSYELTIEYYSRLTKNMRIKAPTKTRVAQNAKGISRLILAKLFPSGGAIKKPIRWRVNINPTAIPLYLASTPSVSRHVVIVRDP